MPIIVVCPKCSAKLNAPDAAAGKKVKCPKGACGTIVSVPIPEAPAFEDAEEAPKSQSAVKKAPKASIEDDAPPKKGLKRSRQDDDEDEQPKGKLKKSRKDESDDENEDRPKSKRRRDDDEEEDRPRRKRRRDDDEEDEDDRPKKKKKKKSGGIPPVAIVGIVVGALVVMGGVGYGIYALAFSDNDSKTSSGSGGSGGTGGTTNTFGTGRGKAARPEGWVKFESADGGFKGYFPEILTEQKLPDQPYQKLYLCDKPSIKTGCLVSVITPKVKPNRNMEKAPDLLAIAINSSGFKELSHKEAMLAGFPALEYVCEVPAQPVNSNSPPKKNSPKSNPSDNTSSKNTGRAVYRLTITDDVIVMVVIMSESGMPKTEYVDGFFDNFELLK